ncbi:MAG: transglycosylase SLT domain-containing protein, partial [Mycobacteriales bacterium]
AQTAESDVSAAPTPDTNLAQRRPPGAELKLAQQQSSHNEQAQSQAAQRAEQVGSSFADRAEAAAADAKKRATEAAEAALGPGGGPPPDAPADCVSYSGVKQIGCSLLVLAGFEAQQMSCLDKLWMKESKWNPQAENKSSGAYGIPQALPGSKMASHGSDWKTNPVPQIKWGLGYIKGRYNTPCGAWSQSQNVGWY